MESTTFSADGVMMKVELKNKMNISEYVVLHIEDTAFLLTKWQLLFFFYSWLKFLLPAKDFWIIIEKLYIFFKVAT